MGGAANNSKYRETTRVSTTPTRPSRPYTPQRGSREVDAQLEMAGTSWDVYSGTLLEDMAERFEDIAAAWEDLRETAPFFEKELQIIEI